MIISNIGGGSGGASQRNIVDNLMGNTDAAKSLSLSAYQGYVLDTKIAAINNNFGNIQVASLTVTAQEASAAGQPVTIANSAYTITANFDSALSVTVPIYTWGDYKVTCGAVSEDIAITSARFDYRVDLRTTGLLLFGDGVNLLGNILAYGSDGNTGKPIPTSQWSVAVNSDTIVASIVAHNINGMQLGFSTENAFDLSKYGYLEIILEVAGSSYLNEISVGEVTVMRPLIARDITSGTLKRTIDITGINKIGSIGVSILASSSHVTWTIKKIMLLY